MGIIGLLTRCIAFIRFHIEDMATPKPVLPITNRDIRIAILNYIKNGIPVRLVELDNRKLSDTYIVRVIGEDGWKEGGESFLFGHIFDRVTDTVQPLYIDEFTQFRVIPINTGVTLTDYKAFCELVETLQTAEGMTKRELYIKPNTGAGILRVVHEPLLCMNFIQPNGLTRRLSVYTLPHFKSATPSLLGRKMFFYGIDNVPMTYGSLYKSWLYMT